MSKNLVSSLLAVSILLTFLSTVAMFAYWTITRAPWWVCDLAALLVFIQGMAMFLWGMASQGRLNTWDSVTLLNHVLRRFGLVLITEQRLRDLVQQSTELTILSAHLSEQKESEV